MVLTVSKKRALAEELLALPDQVVAQMTDLVRQYRVFDSVPVLKQAVDSPARARAGLAHRMARYNAAKGAGAAQAVLAECLLDAQSGVAAPSTLADVNAQLQALETQMAALVAQRSAGASWEEIAAAIEALVVPDASAILLERLPMPPNYTTVWGEPW